MRNPFAVAAGRQRWHNRLHCTAPVGAAGTAPVELAGYSGGSEVLSLTMALWFFIAAGMWIFKRWGRSPSAEAPAPARTAAEPAG